MRITLLSNIKKLVLLITLACIIASLVVIMPSVRGSTKAQENKQPQFAGPLYVHPENGRYFTDGSGEAILLVGSHFWLNLQDGVRPDPPPAFDYTGWLDFLEEHNHNFFRLWVWEQARWAVESGDEYWFTPHPYLRPGPGIALDGKPKFDVSQFNQAYFDRLRARVVEAGGRGMYVSIMLFNGWSIEYPKGFYAGSNPWNGHPYNGSNNINGIDGDVNGDESGGEVHTLVNGEVTALQEAYVKKVIDTLNDLDNVLYEISNESPGDSQNWQYHMIEYIKDYEATKPKQHPVGMTVEWPNGDNGDLYASEADWISPNGDLNNPPVADGSKVVIADTDHLCGICGDRYWVWKSFTRGENPLFMDQYDDSYKLDGGGYDPNNPNDVSLRQNLGYVRTYAGRMDLVEMEPRGDLASSGYALARPVANGAEYLVYLPNGGSVTVDLSDASGELSVEWFRPSNGNTMDGGNVMGGATRSFTTPFGGDAVLYIHDSDNSTPTPGPSPTGSPTPLVSDTPDPGFTPTPSPTGEWTPVPTIQGTPDPTAELTPEPTSQFTPTPDNQPPLVYNIDSFPLDVLAYITWDTNESATSTVYYGLTWTLLDKSVQDTDHVYEHNLLISDLAPETQYYFRVSSQDPSGNVTQSNVRNFSTGNVGDATHIYLPGILH